MERNGLFHTARVAHGETVNESLVRHARTLCEERTRHVAALKTR